MTVWQPQYIPPNPDGRDDIDEPGWYVRTPWDEADTVREVVRVRDEDEAKELAEFLNNTSFSGREASVYLWAKRGMDGIRAMGDDPAVRAAWREAVQTARAEKVWAEAREQVVKELGSRG